MASEKQSPRRYLSFFGVKTSFGVTLYKVLSVNTHSYVIRVRYRRNADKMLLAYVIKRTAFTVEFYLSTTVAMECLHFCSFVFTLLETKLL